jgi:hypothetical protein
MPYPKKLLVGQKRKDLKKNLEKFPVDSSTREIASQFRVPGF